MAYLSAKETLDDENAATLKHVSWRESSTTIPDVHDPLISFLPRLAVSRPDGQLHGAPVCGEQRRALALFSISKQVLNIVFSLYFESIPLSLGVNAAALGAALTDTFNLPLHN